LASGNLAGVKIYEEPLDARERDLSVIGQSRIPRPCAGFRTGAFCEGFSFAGLRRRGRPLDFLCFRVF